MLAHDHRLNALPTVVLNCPTVAPFDGAASTPNGRRLRTDCGLPEDVPLMVYSGSARAARGLDVMIEALPFLPNVACVLVVANPDSEYIDSLRAKARALDVADRLHTVPYVPADEVVAYLSGADVGVIPVQHFVNHEIALITKFFEYAHARLPIVVSDVRAMATEVRSTGIGEFVRMVKKVLAEPDRYVQLYERSALLEQWTWEAQADKLTDLYVDVGRAQLRPQ